MPSEYNFRIKVHILKHEIVVIWKFIIWGVKYFLTKHRDGSLKKSLKFTLSHSNNRHKNK